jgi:hypothetical protein
VRHKRYVGIDETYGYWHREELPRLYRRAGHRLYAADRDWTEFCFYCKNALGLIEEVRFVGQDLLDKGVTVTRQMARSSGLPAWLLAWETNRPPDVQRMIDGLNRQVRELAEQYPITGFRVRILNPHESRHIERLSPAKWAETLLILHRAHHLRCRPAAARDPVLRIDTLAEAMRTNPAWPGPRDMAPMFPEIGVGA